MDNRQRESMQLQRPWRWVFFAMLWLLVLIGFPLLLMFVISLAQRDPSGEIRWTLSMSNYFRAFDALYLRIYLRSLVLAAVTTLLCLVIGFPVAQFIAVQKSAHWKNLLIALVTLPFWTSFLVRTYAWIILLRTDGPINRILLSLRILEHPLDLLYNDFAILIGLVYGELPFMILPLFSVLEKIRPDLLEASRDLGSSSWQTFRRVLLPLSRPGIVAGIILVFVPSVGAFITPDLLGGAKSAMIGNLIQSQFAIIRDQPFGSAIAVLLALLVLLLLASTYASTKQGAEVKVL